MILPTKRISHSRSLIKIGADILYVLDQPKTVSKIWDEVRIYKNSNQKRNNIPFDWFVLALDLLYIMNTIELKSGKIQKVRQ